MLVPVMATFCLACAQAPPTPEPARNSDLTHGNVQLNLKVGETTQTQVLEAFGAPNVTSIDGSSGASGFEQTQRTMTLIVKFDANKVVADFRSRASEF
jgi:outer membrane protein assembly factor BamE (lipoprotein component of BamABCDE complex)